ncbi:MAG: HEAT repeat domain-containing protein [Candidatus Lokiarchaeota archaeon]|nr:HEAT repeat domain-containing protein [Candidatus Lokiarchaeota archaeon]
MTEDKINNNNEMEGIKDLVNESRFGDAVKEIAQYLEQFADENRLDRLENVLETVLSLHGGKTVLRILLVDNIIDIPLILKNLSKRDSVLRYSFLLLLKSICENEFDLILPYINDLLESEDPNVKEAALQLLVFVSNGEKQINEETQIKAIAQKLIEKQDFVREKAIQVLCIIGKTNPSLITKVLTNYSKELLDNEDLKKNIDNILKAIVTIEKIDEIVEEEKQLENITEENKKKVEIVKELKKEEQIILNKELELKIKDIELKKKKLELDKKEKELEEKEIKEKEKVLKKKEELIEKEQSLSQVELELKRKEVEEKEQKIMELENKRILHKMKNIKEEDNNS